MQAPKTNSDYIKMNDYRKKVKLAAAAFTGKTIYNGSIEHAEILAQELFHVAENEVCVLSNELNPRVFGSDDVVEQVKLFLAKPDRKLRVLVEQTSEPIRFGHPFYDEFFDKAIRNAEFREVPKEIQGSYKFNLIVSDSSSYRFEGDRDRHEAVAAFGEKSGAKNLQKVFETLWGRSNPLVN